MLISLKLAAQNVVFSANASAGTIGIEDQVQVTFTIENVEGLQGITQPSFPDFRVLGGPYQSQSSSISFNGNQRVQSVSVSLTYILQATRTGTLTIPPVSAKDAANRSYQCNPLSIQVVKGSVGQQQRRQQSRDPFDDDPFGGDPFAALRQHQQQMQQMLQQMQQQSMPQQQSLSNATEADLGKNIFIKVTVDKTKVRLGEQITATYKLYSRVAMNASLSKLPSLNGFWTQDFDLPQNQQPQTETLNGIPYHTFTLKKSALFPQQTGNLVLDAAEAKGVARVADRSNPFGVKDVSIELKSTPVTITVSPLPQEGRPDRFSGAVGNFTLSSKVDKINLTTDETANLTLDISGTGNLKLIEAPVLQLPNGLDAFEPQVVDTITSRTTTISGHKIFTYPIAPRIIGDYTIPAISFVYFNSKTNTYTTLYTEAVKIHVTAGKNYKKEAVQNKPLTDIHPIIKNVPALQAAGSPLFFSAAYWSIYLLLALGLILFFIWKKKAEDLNGNTSLFKNKYANKIALKRLKTAKLLLDSKKTGAFYEEISKAIWLYLSDKLNIPLSQLSKETAATAMTQKNVSPALQQQATHIIDDCELSLYAPGGGAQQMNKTYTETVQLIAQLEDIFKK